MGLRLFLKAAQMALFSRRAVMEPGKHGGSFYRNPGGDVRYGQRGADLSHLHTGARRPNASAFRLDPPEIGETKSGKPVPHPDDPNAHLEGKGYHHGAKAFRDWSPKDHRDAEAVHREYVEHHEKRAGQARDDQAEHHTELAKRHAAAADRHREGGSMMKAVLFLKADQLGFRFQGPGSRGGRYYYDDKGGVRYGERPVPHSSNLPERVKIAVKHAVDALNDVHTGLEGARRLGGGGRYEAEAWDSQKFEETIARAMRTIEIFREHAPKNGIDAEAVLKELGFHGAPARSAAAVNFFSKALSYEDESTAIAVRKKSRDARQPHRFDRAEWTHKNGHPRCRVCGDDEPTGGRCSGQRASADRFHRKLKLSLNGRRDRERHGRMGGRE